MENKKPIGVVTDEGCDLPQELIEKYEIAVVPLRADWPDMQSMPGNNTFAKMRELEKRGIKSFAKTSQPSVSDFLELYKKQLEKFEKIICLTITSKHSGTFNSAFQAKKFLETEGGGEKVFVIDSLNASGGLGLLVLKVVELIKKGKKPEEIIEEIKKLIPHTHLYFFIPDPKWLEASGRVSHTVANWIRKMQNFGVRPLMGLKQGFLKPVGIKIGVKDVPTTMFKELESKSKNFSSQGKKIKIAITHGDNLEDALRLKEMIEKELKNTEVLFINLVDDVIGCILGPGCLALGWMAEE